MNYLEQGDVLLYVETELPADATPIKGATLALGEFSGHHHTMYDGANAIAEKSFDPTDLSTTSNVKMFQQPDGTKWAQVDNVVYLKHQEHKPIEIAKGLYRIGIVREVDPFSDEIRAVAD